MSKETLKLSPFRELLNKKQADRNLQVNTTFSDAEPWIFEFLFRAHTHVSQTPMEKEVGESWMWSEFSIPASQQVIDKEVLKIGEDFAMLTTMANFQRRLAVAGGIADPKVKDEPNEWAWCVRKGGTNEIVAHS